MARTASIVRERKRIARLALRAGNGAALGALAGGLLGLLLANLSLLIARYDCLGSLLTEDGLRSFVLTSLFGMVPGVPAGAIIGGLIVIAQDRLRWVLATSIGLLTGYLYGTLWIPPLQNPRAVLIAFVLYGLAGGLLMAGFLNLLRRRWSWWTRWDN